VPLGRAPSGPARWTSRARETGRENGHGPTVDLGPARFFFFSEKQIPISFNIIDEKHL
jgi:hypothetical protein